MMNHLKQWWRAYRGYCPNCNLDAPAIDHCVVCNGYRGSWPPPHWLRATWLHNYFCGFYASELPQAPESREEHYGSQKTNRQSL